MDTKQAEALTQKYLDGTASSEERAIFESWYNQSVHNSLDPVVEPDYNALQQRLAKSLPAGGHKTYKLWPRIAVAAAAVAAIVVGVYFFNTSRHLDDRRDLLYYASNDIAPGKNGATITLANGKVIQLSDAKSGVIVGDALKYSDGSDVRYSSGSRFSGSLKGSQKPTGPVGVRSLTPAELQGADGKAQQLTASTAKGQTYQFTLPDGTKVWLNADSKLEFPSSFGGAKQRNVKLSGEGYFEVAKDKAHPFIVKSRQQEIIVLGTHFNINSYADEGSVRTTLLEGSVKVSTLSVAPTSLPGGERNSIVLKPNEQAILTGSDRLQVKDIDVSEAVDWKNGDFIFRNETLSGIMKKVARWYNVGVMYDPGVDTLQTFSGSVSRSKNISAVLGIMQSTKQVKFKIAGNKVTVLANP